MIDAKDTEAAAARRSHSLKAGDTPVFGMPVTPGTGGKRRAPDPEPVAELDGGLAVDEPVTYHGICGWVAAVYPATAEWTRPMCKVRFGDGGKPVVVGVDEVERFTADTVVGRRLVVALEETAPLPSPVPRLARAVADQPTEQLTALDDTDPVLLEELVAEDDERPTAHLSAVGTLPGAPAVARRVGAFEGLWLGLLEILRLIGRFFAWPFARDGGRALAGWIVDQVATGVEAAADWERWHARLLAKIVLAALSVAVFGGIGVAWVVTR
ncbi:hypothetical protein [Amycolatopsis sp. cmx-4-68]|uniref:hypothetical protein n=1 Tax=Amycolatopsis sp. cmx-4-68 TaxID=2790938 RepID=UPI00397B6E8B